MLSIPPKFQVSPAGSFTGVPPASSFSSHRGALVGDSSHAVRMAGEG